MPAKPQSTKDEILAGLGSITFETFHNQLLLGIYIKPEKSAGGIIFTDKTRAEDQWQGKVAVVLDKGPMAFRSDASVRFENDVQVGDWVVYRVSDGFSIDINGIHCRVIEDVHIRAKITDPTIIY